MAKNSTERLLFLCGEGIRIKAGGAENGYDKNRRVALPLTASDGFVMDIEN